LILQSGQARKGRRSPGATFPRDSFGKQIPFSISFSERIPKGPFRERDRMRLGSLLHPSHLRGGDQGKEAHFGKVDFLPHYPPGRRVREGCLPSVTFSKSLGPETFGSRSDLSTRFPPLGPISRGKWIFGSGTLVS
jgi:hypothetical protein